MQIQGSQYELHLAMNVKENNTALQLSSFLTVT